MARLSSLERPERSRISHVAVSPAFTELGLQERAAPAICEAAVCEAIFELCEVAVNVNDTDFQVPFRDAVSVAVPLAVKAPDTTVNEPVVEFAAITRLGEGSDNADLLLDRAIVVLPDEEEALRDSVHSDTWLAAVNVAGLH
ncbi:MAG TPA: hypothetical protein VMA31_05915 [Bryobacteraceae bacterium]|nr:hypothetical protein [Bryobacteraceae bacterium]